jgi:transcriptional regulator with XRE-family HTH domain
MGDAMSDVQTLDQVVKAQRAAAGLTQQELAERAHLGVTVIQDAESAARNLSPRARQKLAVALGLDPDALDWEVVPWRCNRCGHPATMRKPCRCPAVVFSHGHRR